jgi:hypothetical protein
MTVCAAHVRCHEQSGHDRLWEFAFWSLLGVKRTCPFALRMFAIDPKRTFQLDRCLLLVNDRLGRGLINAQHSLSDTSWMKARWLAASDAALRNSTGRAIRTGVCLGDNEQKGDTHGGSASYWSTPGEAEHRPRGHAVVPYRPILRGHKLLPEWAVRRCADGQVLSGGVSRNGTPQ